MLRSCIDVAVKEINASECSIKNLKYEKKYANRRGKPLSQIIFTWQKEASRPKKLEDITSDSIYYTVKNALKEAPEFTEENIISIAKAAKKNGVNAVQIKQRISYVLKQENVLNPTGYIIALMKGFNDAVEIRNTANSFNDFEHNEYDFDELEEALLNESIERQQKSEEPAKKLSEIVKNAIVFEENKTGVDLFFIEEDISEEDREKRMAAKVKTIIEMMKNNQG